MKKVSIFAILLMFCTALVAQEQTVFFADFEYWDEDGSEAFTSRGWTVIEDEDPNSRDKWVNEYSQNGKLSGKWSPRAGAWNYSEHPNDEWLITPGISLSNTAADGYCLDFLWGNASVNIQKGGTGNYTMYVKVKEVGTEDWQTILDLADQETVEQSGVKWPWAGWSTNHSIVDLSAYKGKTIQIAFHYHEWLLFTDGGDENDPGYGGNSVSIDDVTVREWTPLTSPIVETTQTAYTFMPTYIGTASISEKMQITNVGIGELEVVSVEGLEGTDFSCTLVPGAVKAKKNESISYQVRYTPTLMGKGSVTMTIRTNGGDIQVALNGSKIVIPDGYTYHGFEGPWVPAGWSTSGEAWKVSNSSFSGNRCAMGTVNVTAGESWLTSPRIDVSDGGTYEITFDFYEQYGQVIDNGYDTPDSWFLIEFSQDGGQNWDTIFNQDTLKAYNERVRYKYTISGVKSDNCYIRWGYLMEDELDYENIDNYEFSVLYIDDVVLPPLYGAKEAPSASTPVSPADSAINITNRQPLLAWTEVQFATKYRINMGTEAGNWNIISGRETTELSTKAPRLEYNTTYFWQVVAISDYGETQEAPVWCFTTIEDQTIKTFPWFEGFEEPVGNAPMGWEIESENYTRWEIANMYTYEGKHKMLAFGSTDNTETSLLSPEILLPENDEMQLSFFWGNGVTLSQESTGSAVNNTTEPDDIDAGYVEILVDDEWHTLGLISMESEYYNREVFDLSAYKGKMVTLRWRYSLKRSIKWRGVSLDNIAIESKSGVMAYFNATEWAAGMINYGCHLSSGKAFSLVNGGIEPLTISRVENSLDNFTCDLETGISLQPNSVVPFTLRAYADSLTPGDYADTLVVTFTNNQSVELPLSFTSLASDMLYYNFDQDEHGTLNPMGLTTYDNDHYANCGSMGINWPNEGTAYAYCVINVDADHSDWRNVYPISGDQVLSASAPYGCGDNYSSDWVISPKLTATDQSSFSFWGKSYGTDDEFNDFKPHYFEIWVSTTDDNIASFKQVGTRKQISKNDAKWYQYTIDLSEFKGQDIFVALVHCANDYGYIAFFDDFMFSHFGGASYTDPDEPQDPEEGLQEVNGDIVVRKLLRNGHIYIQRGDKLYDLQGMLH